MPEDFAAGLLMILLAGATGALIWLTAKLLGPFSGGDGGNG